MVKLADSGLLLTFEGMEGCGKSTQIALLAGRLRGLGREVVVSREPGATALGLELRKLLLDPAYDPDALTEMLLYLADRAEHCRLVVAPALRRKALVLLDRYVDSTWVYQGFVDRRLETARVDQFNHLVVGNCWPQLTFLLDCPAEIGLQRALRRNQENGSVGVADRFERRRLDFHEAVRRGFLTLAAREPERIQVVDATCGIEDMHAVIWREFVKKYALR
ncbi:MAG TPA: dTMP kinase [Proteobacteria bacterium]|nr:dTMP kinase [Pseudomonadota bacterium]